MLYEPLFNTCLVEIDDKDAEWGSGNDESMLGKSYSKGKLINYGQPLNTQAYPLAKGDFDSVNSLLPKLKGRSIQWNEGAEAGTTFEFDGKLFGMIYWWDIRGVGHDAEAAK